MTYWLINFLTDWLTDWLTSWFLLINGLINWLAEWLILADWLTGWMTDWLAKWQSVSNWLIDWLTDYLTDWLTDWRTVILIDWLTYNWLTQMTQTSDWTSKTHFSLFCANGQRPKEGDWQIRTLTRHTCTDWRWDTCGIAWWDWDTGRGTSWNTPCKQAHYWEIFVKNSQVSWPRTDVNVNVLRKVFIFPILISRMSYWLLKQ